MTGLLAHFTDLTAHFAEAARFPVMYHASPARNRESIGRHGLRTDLSEDASEIGEKGIYMSPRAVPDDDEDVWKVNTSGWHLEPEAPEMMHEFADRGGSYYVTHDVPPERLTLHHPARLHPRTAAGRPCGTDNEGHQVELDEMNGWQHLDGSIGHDDGTSVTDHPVRDSMGQRTVWRPGTGHVATAWMPPGTPFYHGTSDEFAPGHVLTPGHPVNWGPWKPSGAPRRSRHVYMSADPSVALDYARGHADTRGAGEQEEGGPRPHVYEVRPLGRYTEDPEGPESAGPYAYRRRGGVQVVREVPPEELGTLIRNFRCEAAWYHGTSAELEPGELIEPGKYPPSDPNAEGYPRPRDHVYLSDGRLGYISEHYGPGAGGHVYEVEPTGPVSRDREYSSRRMMKSRHPLRVIRRVSASGSPGFPNPYHGTQRFGGRPEWSHTWFHGTRGEPEFGDRRGHGNDLERMKVPAAERDMKGHGWPQPNQMMGVHFSPLHEVAHKFAPSVSSSPSAIVHARLHISNPAHFPTERHLNYAVAHWASQHYPHWHDQKLNDAMAWNYSDREGTRRDFSRPPDTPYGDKAQDVLQWHPHLPEILGGFHRHLREQGHHGITYGNNLEGPYITDATRGGEAATRYSRKMEGLHGSPVSISAIVHPDDIETTGVEHISGWRQDPRPHERTWEAVSDSDEGDEMRDRVLDWHREHGGAYPREQHEAVRKTAGWPPSHWQHRDCGVYACALIEAAPHLRMGATAGPHSDPAKGHALHWFAHDDTHAYDSKGRHPLPYFSVWDSASHDWVPDDAHERMGHRQVLDIDRSQYGELSDEERQLLPAARRHIRQNRVLEGMQHEARKSGKPARSKESVSYRPATGEQRCGSCTMIRMNPPDFESHSCTLVKGLIDPDYVCDEWYPKDGKKTASADPLMAHFAAVPEQRAENFEGETGNRTHITRRETGMIPLSDIAHLHGAAGERPGEHRNRQGARWEEFKAGIDREGMHHPVFITVDHGEDPKLSEGSHRRDAAAELGWTHVPYEATYFGNAQDEGTISERAGRRQARLARAAAAGRPQGAVRPTGRDRDPRGRPDLMRHFGDRARIDLMAHFANSDGDRFVTCGQGHSHWGAHGAAGLLVRHRDPGDGRMRYLLQKRAPRVQHGNTWSTPGGAIGRNETPEAGALREAREELGPLPRELTHHHTVTDWHCSKSADTDPRCPLHGYSSRTGPDSREGSHSGEATSRAGSHSGSVNADGHRHSRDQTEGTAPGLLHNRHIASHSEQSTAGDPSPSDLVGFFERAPHYSSSTPQPGAPGSSYTHGSDTRRLYRSASSSAASRILIEADDGGSSGRYRHVPDDEAASPPGSCADSWPRPLDSHDISRNSGTGIPSRLSSVLPTDSPRQGAASGTRCTCNPHQHDSSKCWAYHTVVMDSPERFTPRGGGSTDYETAGSGWFTHEEMQRLRLHPGFAKTWDSVRRSRIDKEAGYSRKTTCAICGEKARPGDPLTRGHIVPRAAGGSDEPWNIRPEHESCNAARANSYTRDDAAEAERRRHQKEAASGYNLSKRSGMISLDVPESAALAHPSGVIRDHHITVAYLGKDVDDDAYERACKRASEAAASLEGPFAVTLGSLGTFPPSDSSDHKVPVYLHVSPHPALGQLRSQLEDLSASEHKDWKPHVTLAYIEPGEPLPPRGRPQHVGFGHLSVHRGEDEVRRFRLGDGAES